MTSLISTLSPQDHFSGQLDEKIIKKRENKGRSACLPRKDLADQTIELIRAEVFTMNQFSPQKIAQTCSEIMALKLPTSSSISTCPRVSSSPIIFSRAEKKLINQIFKNWALHDSFYFLDIWGVEIFKGIEGLKEYFSIEELMNDFLSNFGAGYHTLQLMTISSSSLPSLEVFYANVFDHTNSQHFLSLEGWVVSLQNLNNKLSTYQTSSTFSDVTNVKKDALIKHIQACVNIGIKWITPETFLLFFIDLDEQMEEHFPGAKNLQKLDIEKNLKDLNYFIKFLSELGLVNVQRKELLPQENYFSHLSTQFSLIEKHPDLFTAMCLFKNELISYLSKQKKCYERYEKAKTLARLGKFSYPQFCIAWQIPFVESESPKNMFEFLHSRQCWLLNIEVCVVSIFQMLDTHLLPLLNPEHHGKGVLLNRFLCHLAALRGKVPSSIPIDSGYGIRSKSILVEINKQIEALYKSLSLKIIFQGMDRRWEALGLREYPLIHILAEIDDILPSLLYINKRTQLGLNNCRLQHLALIRNFFQTLDKEELQTNGLAWVEFFQNICFDKALRFCRIVFMVHDLNQIMDGSQNVPDEELLPAALVDYMSLAGIEDMYADLLKSKIETDLTIQPTQLVTDLEIVSDALSGPTIKKKKKKERKVKPASKKLAVPELAVPVKKKKKKKVVSLEPFIARETLVDIQPQEDVPFEIGRNEKARKVIARLRQAGFLPKRKVKSSHVTLFNEEKGKMTVIPRGGKNHTQLKIGTSKSIQKQIT